MAHLKSLKFDKLSEDMIKKLKNNRIHTVCDLVREDPERVAALTQLPFRDVLDLRAHIITTYCSYAAGVQYHDKILNSFAILPTCMLSLDNLLQGGLRCKITEICGLPDSGKTLLIQSIICNISSILKQNVLYIDTKNDFEATKFKSMMDLRISNKNEVDESLERIKVIKIWNTSDCLSFLHNLYSKKDFMKSIKLIVLDSLPSLVLQFKGENSNTDCFGFLNNFVNITRRISGEYNIPIIITNLLTRWVETIPSEACGDPTPSFSIEVKPTLGRYWRSIPYMSLDVTKKSADDVSIKIRSCNMFTKLNYVDMKISAEGIT